MNILKNLYDYIWLNLDEFLGSKIALITDGWICLKYKERRKLQ